MIYRKELFAMKKALLSLIMLAIMLLSLISCTQTPELPYLTDETATNETKEKASYTYNPDIEDSANNTMNIVSTIMDDVPSSYNGELYFNSWDMLYKLNKETGKMNEMCKDPVCKHDTKECPFFGQQWQTGFHIYDNKIIYLRGREKHALRGEPNRILLYDIENGSFRSIYDYSIDATVFSMDYSFHGGEMYFHERVYDEDTKEFDKYALTCLDLSTFDKEVFYTEDYRKISVVGGDDNNIYYIDLLNKKLCVAKNRDFNNTSVLVDDHAGYFALYKDRVFYVSSETGTLSSKKLDGSDKKDLGISDIYYMYITDKYVYYWQRIEYDIVAPPVSPGKEEQRDTIPLANEIYRCTHDGKNVEVVYKAYDGEPLEMGDVVYVPNMLYVFEGYLYTTFTEISLKDDGTIDRDASTNSRGPFSYMRVNCNTGEVYIIEMPEI
ncbi:MAG: DUF5050 domain-containing protein [Ruminococcaceae bacterium]|nr:DUF5050 domain-containing protein [Oscillospiraceae bacterium]